MSRGETECTCGPTSEEPCRYCSGYYEPDPEVVDYARAARRLRVLHDRLEDVRSGIMDSEDHPCGYNPRDPEDSCRAEGHCSLDAIARLELQVEDARHEVRRLGRLCGDPAADANAGLEEGVPS